MKKYNLLKVILITICVFWLLTAIIPGSTIDNYSKKVIVNSIASNGIWNIFYSASISIQAFAEIAVLLVATACLYSVLNTIDVYNRFVSKTVSIFKTKEKLLAILSIIIFALLGMFANDYLVLIVFIPFIIKVMKELEIDNKVILSSTVVAILIGGMCGIYNDNLFSMYSLKINSLILFKAILFVLSVAALIFLTAPKNTKEVKVVSKKIDKKEERIEANKVTKTSSNKKASKTTKKTSKGKKVSK